MQESAKLFYAGASPVRNSIYGGCRQVVKTIGCDPIIVGSIPTSHPNLEGKVDRVHICLLNKMFFLEECVSNTLPSAIYLGL